MGRGLLTVINMLHGLKAYMTIHCSESHLLHRSEAAINNLLISLNTLRTFDLRNSTASITGSDSSHTLLSKNLVQYNIWPVGDL